MDIIAGWEAGSVMVRRWWRSLVATLVAVVCVVVLSGCVQSEEDKLAEREAQLEQYITEVDELTAEIMAQIPADEIQSIHPPGGGIRSSSDYYEEWPKYYYSLVGVTLFADGKRSTTEVADDLEPWLESVGWIRNEARERSPKENLFRRFYYRGNYTLFIEVYTVIPPQAQKVTFSITSPRTD